MNIHQETTLQQLAGLIKSHPPFSAVRQLNDAQVESIGSMYAFPFKAGKKKLESLLRAIRERCERISKERRKAQELDARFCAWVDSKVGPGGQWIHALAHEGKSLFDANGRVIWPSAYCTKSRVLDAVRRNPELTVREQPYGDSPGDTAPAVFRGKPVPHEKLEDQPLPI